MNARIDDAIAAHGRIMEMLRQSHSEHIPSGDSFSLLKEAIK